MRGNAAARLEVAFQGKRLRTGVVECGPVLCEVELVLGEAPDEITSRIEAVVDELLADDYVLVLRPVVLGFGDNPTKSALSAARERPVPHAALSGDHQAIAAWFRIPYETYLLHPVAFPIHVVSAVQGRLPQASRDAIWDAFEMWERRFENPAYVHRVKRTGLESVFEAWLVAHLDRLVDHGYPVTLAHQQHVLPSRRRPDLLCRFIEDAEPFKAGDWLVIELKATRSYAEAIDQIEAYIAEVGERIVEPGQGVGGLLIADGVDHAHSERLRQLGISWLTMSALGYRRDL